MFCPNCGFELNDKSTFCSSCGVSISSNCQPHQIHQQTVVNKSPMQEEFVDLTNVKNLDNPTAGAHKGTICTAIIMVVGWIASMLLLRFVSSILFNLNPYSGLLKITLATAVVCIPIGTLGLLFTSIIKKADEPLRSIKKGFFILFIALTTFCSTFSVALGLQSAITNIGTFANFISWGVFATFSISFLLITFVFSREHGREGMYAILKAYFISFLLAMILSYLWIKLLEAIFVSIGIIIAAFILFILCGGRFIFIKRS